MIGLHSTHFSEIFSSSSYYSRVLLFDRAYTAQTARLYFGSVQEEEKSCLLVNEVFTQNRKIPVPWYKAYIEN